MLHTHLAPKSGRPKAQGRKRVYDLVLPLKRFDAATLDEARRILTGTSEWFAFDDTGKLVVLQPETTPRKKAWQTERLARLRRFVEDPDAARKELAELESRPRLKWGEEPILYTPFMEKLREKRDAATQQNNYDAEDYHNKALRAATRFHEKKLEEEIEQLKGEIHIADTFIQREARSSRLKALTDAVEIMSKNEKLMTEVNAPFKFDQPEHSNEFYEYRRLESEARALAKDLRNIKPLLPPDEVAAFDDMVMQLMRRSGLWPKHEQSEAWLAERRTKFLDNTGGGIKAFGPGRLLMIQALASLLARSIVAPDFAAAHERFNQDVTLTVHSPDRPIFHAFDQKLGAMFEMDRQRRGVDWRSEGMDVQETLEELQESARRLDQLRRGEVDTLTAEECATFDHEDYDDVDAMTRWGKPDLLFIEMLHQAKGLENQTDTIWRLHNQFPDAVNFLLASRENRFLRSNGGDTKKIVDSASFFGSDYLHQAGRLDLQVAPLLLAQARIQMSGQVIAHS